MHMVKLLQTNNNSTYRHLFTKNSIMNRRISFSDLENDFWIICLTLIICSYDLGSGTFGGGWNAIGGKKLLE